MKTQIKNLLVASFTALLLCTSLSPVNASQIKESVTKTSAIKSFKKITVTGNVQVTIIQNGNEGVAYADDSFGTAKVMQQGDLITISPADNGLAKVIVYVKDIYRITGCDNAVIDTEGLLNTTYLQVFLKGNSRATLNSTTSSICTILADNSTLSLTGATIDHSFAKSKHSTLKIESFAALKTELNKTDYPIIDLEIAAIK